MAKRRQQAFQRIVEAQEMAEPIPAVIADQDGAG
jgi:hypothetical protein